jgi:hypothetical protein
MYNLVKLSLGYVRKLAANHLSKPGATAAT